MKSSNILVLGGNGMLGHVLSRVLKEETDYNIFITARNSKNLSLKKIIDNKNIIHNLDVSKIESVEKIIKKIKPFLVVNCIGAIKQLKDSIDVSSYIYLNSLFPHLLYEICNSTNSRLIQISTDCVFSGEKGNYTEKDNSDCKDLYGRSKFLGEIIDKENVLTLRTSIIGHEVHKKISLLEWFLSQKNECFGYENAIFSGLPTVTLSRVIKNYILKDESIYGLYHLSSHPISKLNLLKKISKIYNKKISIVSKKELKIDRSLDSSMFIKKTGFEIPSWDLLIEEMHKFNNKSF